MLPIREKQMKEACGLEGERRAKKMSFVSKGLRNCYFWWLLSPAAVSSLELHEPSLCGGLNGDPQNIRPPGTSESDLIWNSLCRRH